MPGAETSPRHARDDRAVRVDAQAGPGVSPRARRTAPIRSNACRPFPNAAADGTTTSSARPLATSDTPRPFPVCHLHGRRVSTIWHVW